MPSLLHTIQRCFTDFNQCFLKLCLFEIRKYMFYIQKIGTSKIMADYISFIHKKSLHILITEMSEDELDFIYI